MKRKCKECRWLRTDMAGRFQVHEEVEFFNVLCYPCQAFANRVWVALEQDACYEFEILVK